MPRTWHHVRVICTSAILLSWMKVTPGHELPGSSVYRRLQNGFQPRLNMYVSISFGSRPAATCNLPVTSTDSAKWGAPEDSIFSYHAVLEARGFEHLSIATEKRESIIVHTDKLNLNGIHWAARVQSGHFRGSQGGRHNCLHDLKAQKLSLVRTKMKHQRLLNQQNWCIPTINPHVGAQKLKVLGYGFKTKDAKFSGQSWRNWQSNVVTNIRRNSARIALE